MDSGERYPGWRWRDRKSDGTGKSPRRIKNLRGTLGKVCAMSYTLERMLNPTSALFGCGCQGHNLILSSVWMTESLMGLVVGILWVTYYNAEATKAVWLVRKVGAF